MQPNLAPNKKKKEAKTQSDSLKGTFASVLMLGGFIVVCWFAVFVLFLNRA